MKHSLLGALVALLCVSCSPVADTNAAKEVRSIGKPTEVSFGIA